MVDPMLSVRALARLAVRYFCHSSRRFCFAIRLSPTENETMAHSRITLETNRQAIAIGTVLKPSRPVDRPSCDPLETEFEKRTIMDFEQPIRAWMRKIRVDPDLVSIEGCVVNPRQRQAIREDWVSNLSSHTMPHLRISERNRCGAATAASLHRSSALQSHPQRIPFRSSEVRPNTSIDLSTGSWL
jgi:hypothetical protein